MSEPILGDEGGALPALVPGDDQAAVEVTFSAAAGSLVDWRRGGERQRYLLQERITELELRLRERDGVDDLHELELRAMQQQIDLKNAYVSQLERDVGSLHQQLGAAVAERNALQSAEAQVIELQRVINAMAHRRTYRLADRSVAVIRRMLAPFRRARRTFQRDR